MKSELFYKSYSMSSKAPVRVSNFPAGELNLKIRDSALGNLVDITAIIRDSDGVLALLMLNDAIRKTGAYVRLNMPYVPYARQDRICNKGEAFSLQVFCNLINSCGFEDVKIYDPHSLVTPALLKKSRVVEQQDVFAEYLGSFKGVIMSPDAGASKKTLKAAACSCCTTLVQADKERDLTTGEILRTNVMCQDFGGLDVLICDDICDGGRTFIEIAKVLKERNAGKIILMVTHGIFSKGVEVFDGLIDEIITTNSYCNIKHDKLTVIDIFPFENVKLVK